VRKILALVVLLVTFQTSKAQGLNERLIHGVVNSGDFPIRVGYNLDSGATVKSFIQGFPNLPTTNFVLVQNAELCRFQLSYRKGVNIRDFYFTLVDDLTNKQILSGNLSGIDNQELYKQFGILAEILPIISVKDKTVRLTIYNKLKPSELVTVVLFNRQLSNVDIQHVNRTFKGSVELDGDEKNILFTKESTGIHVVVKITPYPFIYSLSIREKESNRIVFKERVWNHNYYRDEKGPRPHIIIGKNYFEKSGDYEITIQPDLIGLTAKEAKKYSTTRTIHVEVPRVYSNRQMLILGFFIPILVIGMSLLAIFWFKRRNARIIREKNIQKKITDLKLESVRSQLNPHFLFNALSTIQGLINKAELDKANLYLTKFARLTRSVLERENTHSVQEEMKLLDDYLQMEQLRYSFKYQIKASDLDEMNIEIPSMLIQPIVENAVKHGVSDLGERGIIEIDFTRQNKDLSIQIKDNGKGFKISETVSGLGLNLTKERVNLLNETYGQETVFLSFDFNLTGTVVSLNFKNWL
jgi:two-component system LytT family sensor kinase